MLEDVPHAVHVVLSWRYGSTRGRGSDRGGGDDSSSRYGEFLTGFKSGEAALVYTGRFFLLLLFLTGMSSVVK